MKKNHLQTEKSQKISVPKCILAAARNATDKDLEIIFPGDIERARESILVFASNLSSTFFKYLQKEKITKNLHSAILKEQLGSNYAKIRDYLVENGLLEYDAKGAKGRKCFTYNFANHVFGQSIQNYELKHPFYIKNKERYIENLMVCIPPTNYTLVDLRKKLIGLIFPAILGFAEKARVVY